VLLYKLHKHHNKVRTEKVSRGSPPYLLSLLALNVRVLNSRRPRCVPLLAGFRGTGLLAGRVLTMGTKTPGYPRMFADGSTRKGVLCAAPGYTHNRLGHSSMPRLEGSPLEAEPPALAGRRFEPPPAGLRGQ